MIATDECKKAWIKMMGRIPYKFIQCIDTYSMDKIYKRFVHFYEKENMKRMLKKTEAKI